MRKFTYLICIVLLVSSGIAQQHHGTVATKSPDEVWADLEAGNQRYVSGETQPREFKELRTKLAKGQAPEAIILGCADSRVPPELLFDKTLGELFVVRAAGNVADKIGVGSIEYAVEHLGTHVIVVLGHESCGAVTAACSGAKLPSPNLVAIGEAIATACRRNGGAPDVHASVRENVSTSAADLVAHSEILREAVESGNLTIVKAVYDLGSGKVTRFP